MIGSNLPFENEVELFGIGMGLLTVGATWFLAALHGPFTGVVSTTVFALSAPFILIGLAAVTAPAVISPQDYTQSGGQTPKHETSSRFSSSNASADD